MRPTGKINRRDFLRLSAVTVAGASAVACVPAAPATEMTDEGDAAPSAEMVELIYWYDNSYPEATMSLAGEEFNESQANISIEMVPLPYGEAIQKVYVALAGGEAPFDLTFNHPMQRATYAVRGVLIPLNDYIEADDRVNVDNFYPGLVEHLSWQGQIYAIADGAHPMFVLYNPSLIEAAGLKIRGMSIRQGDGRWRSGSANMRGRFPLVRESKGSGAAHQCPELSDSKISGSGALGAMSGTRITRRPSSTSPKR